MAFLRARLVRGLIGCAFRPAAPAPSAVEVAVTRPETEGGPRRLTQAELQPDLMAFADRYATKIGDATILFETRIPSAEARLAALRKRFLDIHSAFTIAAGPNPGSALLDMVVLVTLSRMVWEEVGASGVFGGSVAPITAAYRGLEPDIWSIASDVLTPHQLSLLGHLIQR